ncbi:hypothetical protein SVA_0261 [Sulfurifustis variabilis]|uniref:Uncharacterized protein n=1 Tax=Sulfurifustis variabilis TaxID=1675686 RepID=A0A1B4V0M3_9GAMM|nr:hypothetical protein [Sulfurifustis variabilis]BAU46843.1 hypothetical protein SVA_0261 [Sulfurifustis variabilis]
MEYPKCAFAAPLVAATFGCARAEAVTRRGGPDVACRAAESGRRCAELFERLKAASLPAFGVEDDPERMPHSVLVKIQHGGLLGLQRLVDGTPADTVSDVDALVGRAVARYTGLEAVPCADLVADITGYRLRRRR